MKAHAYSSGCTVPHIRDIGTTWKSVPFYLVHTMKAHAYSSGCTVPHIRDIGTTWKSVPFYTQGKEAVRDLLEK
jgi:hypothetical protein